MFRQTKKTRQQQFVNLQPFSSKHLPNSESNFCIHGTYVEVSPRFCRWLSRDMTVPRFWILGCHKSWSVGWRDGYLNMMPQCLRKETMNHLLRYYMGVSKNRGTPKWMVYNGKPYSNGWFGCTTIFGNIHIDVFEDSIWILYANTDSVSNRSWLMAHDGTWV